jgi:co-chaperonin GroES (HSP10)
MQKSEFNETNIKPVEYKVLVRLDTVDEKVGMIYLPPNQRDQDQYAKVEGTLIDVGALAFDDWQEKPEPGDRVMIAKYAGLDIRWPPDPEIREKEMFRLCNDKDIAAVLI